MPKVSIMLVSEFVAHCLRAVVYCLQLLGPHPLQWATSSLTLIVKLLYCTTGNASTIWTQWKKVNKRSLTKINRYTDQKLICFCSLLRTVLLFPLHRVLSFALTFSHRSVNIGDSYLWRSTDTRKRSFRLSSGLYLSENNTLTHVMAEGTLCVCMRTKASTLRFWSSWLWVLGVTKALGAVYCVLLSARDEGMCHWERHGLILPCNRNGPMRWHFWDNERWPHSRGGNLRGCFWSDVAAISVLTY